MDGSRSNQLFEILRPKDLREDFGRFFMKTNEVSPYKISVAQELKGQDFVRRFPFAEAMLGKTNEDWI